MVLTKVPVNNVTPKSLFLPYFFCSSHVGLILGDYLPLFFVSSTDLSHHHKSLLIKPTTEMVEPKLKLFGSYSAVNRNKKANEEKVARIKATMLNPFKMVNLCVFFNRFPHQIFSRFFFFLSSFLWAQIHLSVHIFVIQNRQ